MKTLLTRLYAPDEGGGAASATPAAAPAPSPEPAPAPAAATPAKEPSISDVLNFDPFEDPKPAAPAPAAPKPTASAAPPAPKPGEAPIPPKPAAQATPPAPVTMDQLKDLLAARTAPPPAPKEEPPAGPKQPRYKIQLPSQILAAVTSEVPEERAAGLNVLVSGILNTAYDAMMEHVEKNVLPQITQVYDSRESVSRERDSITKDFYTKFPVLDDAKYRNYVLTRAQQEAARAGRNFKWTAEVRDSIGNELMELFKLAQPAPGAAPAAPAAPPAKTRYNANGGARPAVTTKSEFEDFITPSPRG